MKNRDFWINQAFFQASWPACVIGAANGLVWPGLLVVGAFALWQLHPSRAARTDLAVVGLFALTGLLLDTLWLQSGLVAYALGWPVEGMTPAWLMALWVSLGLSVNHSLAVFQRRWLVFAALASVASPMSYRFAAELGAVQWTGPDWLVILAVGPVWGVAVAALFRLAGSIRVDDVAPKIVRMVRG